MTKIDYKKMWHEFKDVQIEHFIKLHTNAINSKNERVIGQCNLKCVELLEMDRLDGTKTFHNVLHDLQSFNEGLRKKPQSLYLCPKCSTEDVDIQPLVEENSGRTLGYVYKCNTCGTTGIY